MKRLKLKYPLMVEGSYDKNRVMAVAEGTVIACGGFSVFGSKEKLLLIRRLTEHGKLLVLTDSDGAGKLIRGKLKGLVEAENVINLYTPQIKGKERRKKCPSKAGFLGVEGMSDEVLYGLLAPYSEGAEEERAEAVTGAKLYALGLSGVEDSAARRDALSEAAGLPAGMSAKAFAEAINALGGVPYLNKLLEETET